MLKKGNEGMVNEKRKKHMIRFKAVFLSLLFFMTAVFCIFTASDAFAADEASLDDSRKYEFDLNSNGENEIEAQKGDIITVALYLNRTDSSSDADIYAMQDEIEYDPEFFEIQEDSISLTNGIKSTDIELVDKTHVFYLNFVSMSGGDSWESNYLLGSFQVKVIGDSGAAYLKNSNCSVSVEDGTTGYSYETKDLKVTVSDECTVTFDPQNGDDTWNVTANVGDKIEKPDDPEYEGYYLTGWYTDSDCTKSWDFEKDTVKSNMTLYAGWSENAPAADADFPWWIFIIIAAAVVAVLVLVYLRGRKKVSFMTDGGTQVKSIYVKKGDKLSMPPIPTKNGYDFAGWYKDREFTRRWDFTNDIVNESITLYAKWK